jgi:hypothetical protein
MGNKTVVFRCDACSPDNKTKGCFVSAVMEGGSIPATPQACPYSSSLRAMFKKVVSIGDKEEDQDNG